MLGCYIALLLYFKQKGGYKPVEIEALITSKIRFITNRSGLPQQAVFLSTQRSLPPQEITQWLTQPSCA